MLILMFEIDFLKAANGLDNAISLGSLFHSVMVVGWLSAVCKSTLWSELSTIGDCSLASS